MIANRPSRQSHTQPGAATAYARTGRTHLRPLLSVVVLLSVVTLLLFSHPFMKLPCDVWDQLIRIVSLHDEGTPFVFWPDDMAPNMNSWHWLWAMCFRLLRINDIFAWAKIIHVTQTVLALFCVTYFSDTVFRYLLADSDKTRAARPFLVATSTVLWLIGNGTFAVAWQQAWIMWYSVNYQGLTIPLFWYMLALTVRLFSDRARSRARIRLDVLQILALFPLLMVFHPSEGAYYLISLAMFCLVWMRDVGAWVRRRWYYAAAIPLALGAMALALITFKPVPIPSAFSHGSDPLTFLRTVSATGRTYMSERLNRFPNSFSEIAIISIAAGLALLAMALFGGAHGPSMKKKLLSALVALSLLFFLIPTTPLLAGLACVLTDPIIVWRFYFASPWFMFVPLLLYFGIAERFRTSRSLAIALATASLTAITLILLGSRFLMTGVTYQNARSIALSFAPRAVGVQYSAADIRWLREIISQAELHSPTDKPRLFYIRGDLAPIVRGVFRKYLFADRKRQLPRQAFFDRHLDARYTLVDIDLPPSFPKDQEIFRNFPLEKQEPSEP